METINMQCKSTSIEVFAYAESCLSGRRYIREVPIQIWLKSMKK